MPFYGPGHFESRARVAWPLLGVVLTVGFLLVGLFADLEPRPPDGELVTATVHTVVPDPRGRPYYVAVRAVTSRGTVTCSMGKQSFPDGVLPALGARFPVAWTPDHCAWGEPAEQFPRWFFFLVAAIAGTLTGGWLLSRAGEPRR